MYPIPLLLLCVASGLVAGGLSWWTALRTPARWTPEEALLHVGADRPDRVTLRGELDAGGALYDRYGRDPAARRCVPSPSAGPIWGEPVMGPGAVPRERWPERLGLTVRAPRTTPAERPLDRLGPGLWALAPSGPGPNRGTAGSGPRDHYGVLRRVREVGADSVARVLLDRASAQADDWVIDEDPDRTRAAERTPVHLYVPVRGTDRRVWLRVQVLRGFQATAAWYQCVGDVWTGVWFPAGTHGFAPPGRDPAGSGVAVLSLGAAGGEQRLAARPREVWAPQALVLTGLAVALGTALALFVGTGSEAPGTGATARPRAPRTCPADPRPVAGASNAFDAPDRVRTLLVARARTGARSGALCFRVDRLSRSFGRPANRGPVGPPAAGSAPTRPALPCSRAPVPDWGRREPRRLVIAP